MRFFKNWPVCEKHGNTYSEKTGCLNCKKEKCQCKYKRTILKNHCTNCGKIVGIKRLDEVLEEMKKEGMIPNVKNDNNNT